MIAVIVIIAFLLGVSAALFCFRLKEWQETGDHEA